MNDAELARRLYDFALKDEDERAAREAEVFRRWRERKDAEERRIQASFIFRNRRRLSRAWAEASQRVREAWAALCGRRYDR